MSTKVELRHGIYRDSVVLMQVSQAVAACRGVTAAIVAMATPLNIEIYERLGFDPEAVAAASPNDLLVAVRAEDDAIAAATAELERQLAPSPTSRTDGFGSPPAPRTLASALRHGGSLALISVPGQHAFVEAMDAIQAGVSVMLFSDNVPIEQEIVLKDEAACHEVLVMGPDCGTAVVGGLGLGFANALRPGPVGMVAASGTGAQEVTCLLDAEGVGVTAVLGVGGRDLSAAVGGRSTLAAMRVLDEHRATEFIAVLSKPPDPKVAEAVRAAAQRLSTPSLVSFVGMGQGDLTAATAQILAALGRTPTAPPEWRPPYERGPRAGFIRGLFSGGTLCDEAMAIAAERLGPIASNTPLQPAWVLGADLHASGHLMIDFGDDRLTAGRPHPMIDQSLRLERIAQEASDPACAVLLLDVVLGYGAHRDPASELAPAIAAARERAQRGGHDLAVVVSLVGSLSDPQGRDATAETLAAAGASVHLSNAAAARTAVNLVEGAGR
ncbi:MAG: FdrA family protein [Acidimicrobiales bacterium]|jgi:FdrA protein